MYPKILKYRYILKAGIYCVLHFSNLMFCCCPRDHVRILAFFLQPNISLYALVCMQGVAQVVEQLT